MTQKQNTLHEWKALAEKELRGRPLDALYTHTPEGISIAPLYSKADLEALELNDIPGLAPFARGVKATMYAGRPWTVRQYAGFSDADESNAFYKRNLAAGQKGLSVAFDLATHRGYDSDHPRVAGDVGKAGVAIDSVEDMKRLFDGIPLEDISVSMTMNGAVLPIMAFYIVAAEEQGIAPEKLAGTIQNDILKEFMVRNTYIYPPDASIRIVSDIIDYTANHMPRFNSISISGYHMHEAGATAVQELAYTIADGEEYVKVAMKDGLDIDRFAPRLSFFFGIGMHFFMEVAKLRAARILWARVMEELGAKDPKSKMLRTHCQTSGVSLQEQDPYNNIIRTTVEALAAVLGGTQSLHTNAFDEAIALPTDTSARVARNTQLILEHEAGLTHTVDPLGGSYYVESLTHALVEHAWAEIVEIRKLGGMTKAIEAGLPKRRIEESATRKQARIDAGHDVIVGVNRYQPSTETKIDVLEIDNAKVLKGQLARLKDLRAARDNKAVEAALEAVRTAAKKGGNLLAASVEAARVRATLGEISSAMEDVFGRHVAKPEISSGVYKSEAGTEKAFEAAQKQTQDYVNISGKRPKLLVVKMGQDGHDRGANVIASAFSDLGFEMALSPMFQTPSEVVAHIQKDTPDVVGVSSLAGAHKTLVPELMQQLKAAGLEDVMVVAGGVIPRQDYDFLHKAGVAAIFGPGTPVPQSAAEVLRLLEEKRRKSNYFKAT